MESTVLVGVVRNREQLEANIEHKFYHIPAGNIADDKWPIRYVGLYLSESSFGSQGGGVCYIGEVEDVVQCPRSDITELPAKYPNADYCRFNIKKWMKFAEPVKIHKKFSICTFVELSSIVSV